MSIFTRGRNRKSRFSILQALGKRENQEDSCGLSQGSISRDYDYPDTFIVADGMGGHASGEIASQIAVEESLKTLEQAESFTPRLLFDAVTSANDGIRDARQLDDSLTGMGTTLLITVFARGSLYWISVGDSPLYGVDSKYRVTRLNADHSMKPVIEAMRENGSPAAENTKANQLRAALQGETIDLFDLSEVGTRVDDYRYFILASDGLETLNTTDIGSFCKSFKHKGPDWIAKALIAGVEEQALEAQDNVSLILVDAKSFRHK